MDPLYEVVSSYPLTKHFTVCLPSGTKSLSFLSLPEPLFWGLVASTEQPMASYLSAAVKGKPAAAGSRTIPRQVLTISNPEYVNLPDVWPVPVAPGCYSRKRHARRKWEARISVGRSIASNISAHLMNRGPASTLNRSLSPPTPRLPADLMVVSNGPAEESFEASGNIRPLDLRHVNQHAWGVDDRVVDFLRSSLLPEPNDTGGSTLRRHLHTVFREATVEPTPCLGYTCGRGYQGVGAQLSRSSIYHACRRPCLLLTIASGAAHGDGNSKLEDEHILRDKIRWYDLTGIPD